MQEEHKCCFHISRCLLAFFQWRQRAKRATHKYNIRNKDHAHTPAHLKIVETLHTEFSVLLECDITFFLPVPSSSLFSFPPFLSSFLLLLLHLPHHHFYLGDALGLPQQPEPRFAHGRHPPQEAHRPGEPESCERRMMARTRRD